MKNVWIDVVAINVYTPFSLHPIAIGIHIYAKITIIWWRTIHAISAHKYYSFDYNNIHREINNNNMTLRSRFARLSEGKEKVNRIKMKCFLKRTSRPGFASFTPRCVCTPSREQYTYSESVGKIKWPRTYFLYVVVSRISYYYIYIHAHADDVYNMYTSNANKPQQFRQNFSQPLHRVTPPPPPPVSFWKL